jgi:outer membrane protein
MYKKILMALLTVFALSTASNADIMRVEAGAGIWAQEPTANGSTGDSESDVYVWAYVKHFVPLVPNLRVEYVTATAGVMEFSQIDVIPYYNILDNTGWITLDIGLDIKMIDLTLDTDWGSISTSDADSLALPLAYARTRFQLPLSGLGAEVDAKAVSYADNTIYDVRAKIDYTLDITPVIQPGIELGYRIQKIETDELLPIDLDIEFSGIYAGAMLRF